MEPSRIHALWADTDDAKLREMAEKGLSFRVIGEAIGRSRNSVIGRAHRLGVISTWVKPAVSKTPGAVKQRAKPAARMFKPKIIPVQDNKLKPRYAQPEASTTAFGTPRTLMGLQPHHCKFPIGERDGQHLFCCGDREGLAPYCSEHLLVAWRPIVKTGGRFKLEKLYR